MESFLERYISEEKYLHESPLKPKEFCDHAKKYGLHIQITDLENLEKDSKFLPLFRVKHETEVIKWIRFKNDENNEEYTRPAYHGINKGERLIEEFDKFYYSKPTFDENSKTELLEMMDSGLIYEPSDKNFSPWKNYKGERLENGSELVETYYSSFQILELFVTLENPKSRLITDKSIDEVRKLRNLLVLSQTVYIPYLRSGGGSIQISISDEKLKEKTASFNLSDELNTLNVDIGFLAEWYKNITNYAAEQLGMKLSDDWFQLFKNIFWKKKDKLEGRARVLIELMQWAYMIKIILEDYLKTEIADIDEVIWTSTDNLLAMDLNVWSGRWTPRSWRNMKYIDLSSSEERELREIFNQVTTNSKNKDLIEIKFKKYSELGFFIDWEKKGIYFDKDKLIRKNYYYDSYKRKYYLANSFGYGYHPRAIVYVEGAAEAKAFDLLCYGFHGRTENFGIEWFDIRGVSNFIKEANLREQVDKKPSKILVSNFNALISYNLDKWQTIPYFVGDKENNIENLLNEDISVTLEGQDYSLPGSWKFIWPEVQDAFEGKDFEFCNFTNEELVKAIAKVNGVEIKESAVSKARTEGKSIKEAFGIKGEDKPKLAEVLSLNLIDDFERSNDKTLLKRPIFHVLEEIISFAVKNHPPSGRIYERENKEVIKEILLGKVE